MYLSLNGSMIDKKLTKKTNNFKICYTRNVPINFFKLPE